MNNKDFLIYNELTTKIIRKIQEKTKFSLEIGEYPRNWNHFILTMINKINENDLYDIISNVTKLPLYNDEKIIEKRKDLVIAEGKKVFLLHPFIENNAMKNLKNIDMLKEWKIGLIKPSQLKFILTEPDNNKTFEYSEDKERLILVKEIINAVGNGIDKLHIQPTSKSLNIIQEKNKRKLLTRTHVSSQSLSEDLVQEILNYIQERVDKSIKLILTKNNILIDGSNVVPKYIITIKRINEKYQSLSQMGIFKKTYQSLMSAINKKSGIIIISGQKGSGVSTTLNALIYDYKESNPESVIHFYTDQFAIKNKLAEMYVDSEINEENSADLIIVDREMNAEFLNKAINESLKGKLVIFTIESKDSIDTLKILKHKYSNINHKLLTSELLGIYHQELIPKVDVDNSEEIPFISHENFSEFVSYDNVPSNQNMIYKELIKENSLTSNMILVSEWLDNNNNITENLNGELDTKSILIEKRSSEWIDLVENALIHLKNKEITIEEIKRQLKIK